MNNKQDERTIKFGIECVRARMSNSIARCYFAHHHDEDHEGRMTCYFSGTIETGEFGFWVGLNGEATPDHTVGSGELPTAKIVDPCVRAAKLFLRTSL